VYIKIIISLLPTANSAGLKACVIPVFRVADEHVLQTCIMPASFVSVCMYLHRVFWKVLLFFPRNLDRLACLSHTFENCFRCGGIWSCLYM